MIYSIDVLKSRKEELIMEMTDTTKTNIQKLALTYMCDDIDEAIRALNKAFFKRNVPQK